MSKKIISILLVLFYVLNCFSTFAAENTVSTVYVPVRVIKDKETTKILQFVRHGDELYISASDLEYVTRYNYTEAHSSGDYAWFFLGHKIVLFFYNSDKVYLPDQKTTGTYGGAVEYNGTYYFHLSSVLSWLDCPLECENNSLTFSPMMTTYYELTKDHIGLPSGCLDDYLKDGESSFWLLAGTHALNNVWNFGESICNAFKAAVHNNSPEYFNQDEYVNAFTEMANPDYIGGEIAEKTFGIIGNIASIDKWLDDCGIDLADPEFENQVGIFMAEYALDSSVQNSVYNVFDSIRAFRALSTGVMIVAPIAKSITSFRANMNSLKGYQDALNALVQHANKNSVVYSGAKEALSDIKAPYQSIAKNYIDAVGEELAETLIDKTVGSSISVISVVGKILFPYKYKETSEKSKIIVYYDISSTADSMIKNGASAADSVTQQKNVNAMLLSALAKKRTLECFLYFGKKLESKSSVNDAIAECDEFISKLLLVDCHGVKIKEADIELNFDELKFEYVSDSVIREAKYISGLTNGYAWVRDKDKFVLSDTDGRILGKLDGYTPYAKTNSSGYTLVSGSTYAIVDSKGTVVASEESLNVKFVIPDRDKSALWYEYDVPGFEDGYILAYSMDESYNGVTYKIGILGANGQWVVPPSSDHPILKTSFCASEYEIKNEIFYSNDGIYSFKTAWNIVSFYDAKLNKVSGSVNLLDVDLSIENFDFDSGKTLWKTVYVYDTYYYSLTPNGTVTNFLKTDGSHSIFENGETYILRGKYFWVDNVLYSRDTLSALSSEKNQLYYDYKYPNGIVPKLIENSEGTTYLGFENANGYIFEPIKVSFDNYLPNISYDGKYALIESDNVVYIYDYAGNQINEYDVGAYVETGLSNGVVRCKYNGKVVYTYTYETPDKYFYYG
ncbi:MAG: hypothetical protein IJ404_03860 [Clostridia bacterium]|nr:hypothetical protein [Clostridia bacterium]